MGCLDCSVITKCATWAAPERAPQPIGRITLDAKRAGKRRTGNPFAPFEAAGAGDGLTANLHGHEAGNGGYSQGEPTGYRASPRPYYAQEMARLMTQAYGDRARQAKAAGLRNAIRTLDLTNENWRVS